MNIWEDILASISGRVPTEDFRRYFGDSAYASDSGDQITVWVPTEAIRRHIGAHYWDEIARALVTLDRAGTQVRFVVTGIGDEEEE